MAALTGGRVEVSLKAAVHDDISWISKKSGIDSSQVKRTVADLLADRSQPSSRREDGSRRQYVSLAFGQKARGNGIARSMGKVDTAYDNSVAETFFAKLKKELIYRLRWPERQELNTGVFNYIETFYNRKRRHSRLGWISPAQFEGEELLPLKKPYAIASP